MLGLFAGRINTAPIRNVELALPDGVTFRRWQDQDDFAAMAAVVAGCRETDQIDGRSEAELIPTASDLARVLTPEYGHDPAECVLIVEADRQVVGYNVISWWVESDETRLYHHRGYLLPEWRGRGLGTAMLRWAEARIAEIASAHPYDSRIAISAHATSSEKGTSRLLLREGYIPHQSFDELALPLKLHLPETYLPLGFELRLIGLEQLPEVLAGDMDSAPYHTGLWRAAWSGDALAGVVRCEPSQHTEDGATALVTGVEIGNGYQGSGLARALLLHALHGLKRRGFTEARMFVPGDSTLDDQSLYTSVGFRRIKQYVRFRKALNN